MYVWLGYSTQEDISKTLVFGDNFGGLLEDLLLGWFERDCESLYLSRRDNGHF